MTPMVPIAMFGWIPVVIILFRKLKPHHAVIAGFLLAWMFLPQYDYELPGLPNYSKVGAACYGILLATFLYQRPLLTGFRFHALDLPITFWCLSSFLSSLANGLGFWDGLSSLVGKLTVWGIPYFIGRLYFNRVAALKDLCIGIFFGALLYVPFCLFEVVMSPRLHRMVYGFHAHNFGQAKRGGGWRPVVFMEHGLMTAMWMVSGALAGLRLRGSVLSRRLPWIPISTGLAVLVVLITAILCKSLGSFVLMCMGLLTISLSVRLKSSVPAMILILIPVLYMGVRGSGAWDAQSLVNLARSSSSDERAGSLEFRIHNENVLVDKALDRPLFGWAGWKRSYIRNDAGVTTSVPDGLWIIAFGQNGLFGLSMLTLTLLLPQWLFLRMFPGRTWQTPLATALVPLSILLGLFMIDNLLNNMFNPVMLLSAGGLTGLYIGRRPGPAWMEKPDSVPVEPGRSPRLI